MVSFFRPEYHAPRMNLKRIRILSWVVVIVFGVILVRLFFVQVVAHGYYQGLADRQQMREVTEPVLRGEIYARDRTAEQSDDLYPLAVNRTFYEVYLVPNKITRPINTAQALHDIVGVDYEIALARAKKENDIYEPIYSRATDEQIAALRAAGLEGIQWKEQILRYYPDGTIGSHVLGFYGIDGTRFVGRYGIEGYWENELAPPSEIMKFVRDANGERLPVDTGGSLAQRGSDIVLTIDRTIEYQACTILSKGVEKYGADKGSIIVMESATGRILALCNIPDFDPNQYNVVDDVSRFNDDAVFEAYEPGSVFKPIAMAVALDLGLVKPNTTYQDTGEVKIAGFTIHNFDNRAHGLKTMTQVLQESLNTGIVFATGDVPNKTFYTYVKQFGFGQKTGITISQEGAGSLGELAKHKDVFKATASFGQGITVTALQMISGINALANGGVLVKPYIVEAVRRPDGTALPHIPEPGVRVVKKETADTATAMLVEVADEGYDRKAAVPGYYLAGKTGTANVVEKGVYTQRTNHTFVGYGPAYDPKFTVLIRLNNAKNVGFASDSTTPLFNELARFLLSYYKISPSR